MELLYVERTMWFSMDSLLFTVLHFQSPRNGCLATQSADPAVRTSPCSQPSAGGVYLGRVWYSLPACVRANISETSQRIAVRS